MTASDDIKAVAAMLTEGLSNEDRLSLALALLSRQELPDRLLPYGTVVIDMPGHGAFDGNPRVYIKNSKGWPCSNGTTYMHGDLDRRVKGRSVAVIHIPNPAPFKDPEPIDDDFEEPDDFDGLLLGGDDY